MVIDFHFDRDEQYRNLLSRHFFLEGLRGERRRITNLVEFVRGYHSNFYRALDLFGRQVACRHGVRQISEPFASIYRQQLQMLYDGNSPHPSRSEFLNGEHVYSYSSYWKLSFVDGSAPGGFLSALRWHAFKHIAPQKKKKRNPASTRSYVYGSYRRISTFPERRDTEAHCAEYGNEIVRGARRSRNIPDAWDDLYWNQQKCWKEQRKTNKQWQRCR